MGKQKTNRMRRAHERISTTLPVHLAGMEGATRDISVGGIYFEFDTTMPICSEINFEVDVDTTLGPMQFKCKGQVVRTEQNGKRTGVAVKLIDSRLEAAQ